MRGVDGIQGARGPAPVKRGLPKKRNEASVFAAEEQERSSSVGAGAALAPFDLLGWVDLLALQDQTDPPTDDAAEAVARALPDLLKELQLSVLAGRAPSAGLLSRLSESAESLSSFASLTQGKRAAGLNALSLRAAVEAAKIRF